MRMFQEGRRRTRLTPAVLLILYLPACHSWRVENVAPEGPVQSPSLTCAPLRPGTLTG